MKNKKSLKKIVLAPIGLAFLVLVISLSSKLMTPFTVSGESMSPTFSSGQNIKINTLAYVFSTPKRGDLVVTMSPDGSATEKTSYLKRIVGLPGETVIIKDGQVFIWKADLAKPEVLTEPYLAVNLKTLGNQEKLLGSDEYYLLGDNREPNASIDSRIWGPVKFEYIIGKAWAR